MSDRASKVARGATDKCVAPAAAAASSSASSSSTSASAQSESAAAAVHATASSPPPPLYLHALQSIFSFCALGDVSRTAAVCRSWQSAAFSTPSLKLVRLGAKLSSSQLDEAMAALKRRKVLREANGPRKQTVLQQLRKVLREQECADVGGATLLAMMQTAEITRKVVSRGDSPDTRIRLRLPVAGNGASQRVTKASPAVELQLSWSVSSRGYEDENSWSVLLPRADGARPERLLHFSQMIGSSGDPDGIEFTVRPLADWLRERGVLTGDARQQYTLLWLAVETLFQLADDGTDIDSHINDRGGQECAAVCGYATPRQNRFGGKGPSAAASRPAFNGLHLQFIRWLSHPPAQTNNNQQNEDEEKNEDEDDEDEE